MSNLNSVDYKGNSVFRNQPNHSYFDKPFEDENDILFQFLNDIDPHFLTPQQKADTINTSNTAITDPRTRKPLDQLCYDYTKEVKTEIFAYPKKSLMTKQEHELGVRVLQLLQQCSEVEEEELYNWHRIQKKRLLEIQCFQKFVLEFSKSRDEIYAPCRRLLELYQHFYNCQAIRLMKRYPERAYNTHLGLPNVRQCNNVLKDRMVKIRNIKIVKKVGQKCRWEDNMKDEFKKLNYSLSSFLEVHENSETVKESLEDNLHNTFEKLIEEEISETPCFYIPLESFLFLLTAGDYIDIPTDMIINIKEAESSAKKYIVMDLPLPSRKCGLHTYTLVVEQAVLAMISLQQTKDLEENHLQKEISSNEGAVFKVSTMQEFMIKTKLTADKYCRFSKALIKWQLSDLEDEVLQLYTSLDTFVENKPISIKLEHKSKLGCEVLTKCEILKELFRLKLVGVPQSSCLRLDTINYQILLEEQLNEQKLEEQLLRLYHVNINQLLNNLFEFLKMLFNMPLGHYMLRYNPKFKDKIMLCKPSEEITQNTIYLHKLINTNVTNLDFMTEPNGLPIDENLCSVIHLQHQILPASFSPHAKEADTSKNNYSFGAKSVNTKAKKELKKSNLNKSKMKRIRKIKRDFATMLAKDKELNQLQ